LREIQGIRPKTAFYRSIMIFGDEIGRKAKICQRDEKIANPLSLMALYHRRMDLFLVGDYLNRIARRARGDAEGGLISQPHILYIVEHLAL
jgi:hypothetical protein